tara:strand:+ start:270 stop:620 length:351 start_codon:yes stop_codon:yes gene_type:complete
MSTTLTKSDAALVLMRRVELDHDLDCSIEFYQELIDLGIETPEQFEDAYQGCHDKSCSGGMSGEAVFTEEMISDCYTFDIPTWVYIDWQKTWNDALSFDYSTIEDDGVIYFFNNNF